MTKICFIDGLSNVSAAQIYDEISNLDKNYEFYFITSNECKNWPFQNNSRNIIKNWRNHRFVRSLYSLIRKIRPDIVHIFFEIRMFGSLKSSVKLPVLLLLIRLTGVSTVLTLYSPFITKRNEKWEIIEEIPLGLPKRIISLVLRCFVRTICTLSNEIIVETNIIKDGLFEYYKIDRKKIHVIKNVVLLSKPEIDFQKKNMILKKYSGKKIIFCFGVISPRKGQNYAIMAFNKIKDVLSEHILVIAGIKTKEFKAYEEMLKQLIKDFDLSERVFILDELSDAEVNIFFELSDIVLYPYLPAIYGSGAFSYAIQYNKPAIVTKIHTFKEILGNEGALFIEPKQDDELAKAILQLQDPLLREKLKQEMFRVGNKRNPKIIATEHLKIYQQTISKHR